MTNGPERTELERRHRSTPSKYGKNARKAADSPSAMTAIETQELRRLKAFRRRNETFRDPCPPLDRHERRKNGIAAATEWPI